jgi:hypothetical protein
LYVETRIRVERDVLWRRTQDPAEHQRWDLRFTSIDFLAREPGRPQGFTYAIRIPWRQVAGVGVTVGEKVRPDGQLTSALQFSSPDRLSPIRAGRGWWRYVPDGDGFRFLTGYDYDVRWGATGRFVDRWAFRPWMGWATAWSFDRLRIWCERGVPPERSRNLALGSALARCAVVAAAVPGQRRRWLPVALGIAIAFPRPFAVPRARRCRRAPLDALDLRAPSITQRLEQR